MHIQPVLLCQLDRLRCEVHLHGSPCELDSLRKADFACLLLFSSLHTRIQHVQADKSQHLDSTIPLDSPMLEKPVPEDCCQVYLAAKCTNTAHRRYIY